MRQTMEICIVLDMYRKWSFWVHVQNFVVLGTIQKRDDETNLDVYRNARVVQVAFESEV